MKVQISVANEKTISEYADTLTAERKAKNTVEAYMQDIRKLCQFLESRGTMWLDLTTESDLSAYLAHLKEKSFKDATITRSFSVIRDFFNWFKPNKNPAKYFRPRYVPKGENPALSSEEVEEFLFKLREDARKKQSNSLMRNYLMALLLWETGAQISDILAINTGDIDTRSSELMIRIAGKEHAASMKLSDTITEYIMKTRSRTATESTPLFISRNGERITRQGIWNSLKMYGMTRGFPKITPRSIHNAHTQARKKV